MAGEIRFNFIPGQVDEAIAYNQAKVVGPALEEIRLLNAVVPSGLSFFRGARRNVDAKIEATKINTASRANSIERSIKANRQTSEVVRPYFRQPADQVVQPNAEQLHSPLAEEDERFITVVTGHFRRAFEGPAGAAHDKTRIILLDTSEPGWKPSPAAVVQTVEGLGFADAQDQFAANRRESESGEVSTSATISPDQWPSAGGYETPARRSLTVSYMECGPDVSIAITSLIQTLSAEPLPPTMPGL